MKKYISSPLCSALVVPGMGQVLNNKFKKGVIMMALVFILFIAITVKLVFLVVSMVKHADLGDVNGMMVNAITGKGASTFWILVIFFCHSLGVFYC